MRAAGKGAAFSALFAAVYGTTNWITSLHAWRVPVHMQFELAIPLVPAAAWVYMSVNLLMAVLPFVLRTAEELDAFLAELRRMLAVAAVFFLLVPAETAYAPAHLTGASATLLTFADRINLDHNLLPSLHVALAAASARVMAARLGVAGTFFVWLWALAIAASTLLTHQHHVLDVAGGFALARCAPVLLRWTRNAPAGSAPVSATPALDWQSVRSETKR